MIAEIAAAAVAAGAVSARWNWWRPRVKGLPCLMYHKVGDAPPGSRLGKLWVTAEQFRRQMLYLKERGYAAVTFSQLNGAELPSNPVLVTFDDGYANNYELAYPILRETGMKGNVFLVYETLDRDNAWHDPAAEPRIPMLAWDQVRRMQDSGVVEFGSHTMRHRNLATLSAGDVKWEVSESKRRLEAKLGREVTAFAYPYGAGAYVPAVRAAAREAGYAHDFGIKQGISPWPWDPASGPLKRLFIRGDDTMLDFHLNMTRGRARL